MGRGDIIKETSLEFSIQMLMFGMNNGYWITKKLKQLK
jgi:hypothetical protein